MVVMYLGKKIRQSQMFTEDGMRIPVTVLTAGPCYITDIRDGGAGKKVQLGFGEVKHITKPQAGRIKKAGLEKKLRFFRSTDVTELAEDMKPGKELKVADVFQAGDKVSVTGTSKGKGFAGVVKRHGFRGGPRTHGQSDRERAPGSIGQTTTPGRVYRGKRMAGRMGTDTVTVTGLTVVSVDNEQNLLTVKGLVPGPAQGYVVITKDA